VEVPADKPNDSSQDPNKEDPSDKMSPDHPRFKEVLNEKKAAEERATKLEEELAELRSQKIEATYNSDDLSAEEQASLDKIKKHLAKDGFVTQGDLTVQRNADTLRKLNEKYDGKNGLPAFDRADVVAYSKKNGFGDNYEAAYRDMHFDTIVEVNAKKRASSPEKLTIEKPSGGGEATTTKKFSREDIAKMSDAEYDKYRIGLLNAIKPH
jgi:hypothetical protein